MVGLICSVLSGHAWRLGLPLSPDRILVPAGMVLLLIIHRHRAGGLRWRAVHSLMAATVLWVAWSALGAGTLWTSYGAFALLDRLVLPFALFTAAPLLFSNAALRDVLLKALVVLGIYLGGTAVLEMVGPTSLVVPRYIMDPGAGILFGRARGPFVAAEANGMVLATCFFASGLASTRFSGWWRAAAVLALPLTGLGVVLTLTRSVWLGTLVGAVVVALTVPALRRRLPALAVGAVVVVASVPVLAPALSDVLVERLTTQRSVHDRQNTNAAGLRAVAEHPLTGVGWVRFLEVGTDYVRQDDDFPVTNVRIEIHNVVLARAAETGLPGAALWVGAVLAGPVRAARRLTPTGTGGVDRHGADLAGWRLVLIGTGAVWLSCIMLSPVPYPLPNYLLWLLSGIVARPWLLRAPDQSHHDAAQPLQEDPCATPAHSA